MNKSLSLRKNFLWAFFGNSVFYLCQFGIFIVLAKLGSPEMLGTYSYAVAIVIPFAIFGKLQLQVVFVTDAKNEYLFADYLVLRILTTVVTILAITVVAAVVADSAYAAILIIIVGAGQGFLSIREMYLSAMQKAERMDMFSISNMIQGLFGLIVFFLVIWCCHSLLLAVVGLLLVRVVSFILYDYFVIKKLPAAIGMGDKTSADVYRNWRGLAQLVWLSIPIGITAAMISLQVNITKYFIKHYYSETTLGYYAAMVALLAAGQMVISALGQTTCPRLAKYFVTNKTAFRHLLTKLVAVGFILGVSGLVITFFFGKFILTMIFSADYAVYHKEFNWIMLFGAVAYVTSFFGYGVTAARYFRIPLVIWTIVAGVTAVSCYLLVPSYSIKGAAWAMSIASGVNILLIFVTTVVILREPPKKPPEEPVDKCSLLVNSELSN